MIKNKEQAKFPWFRLRLGAKKKHFSFIARRKRTMSWDDADGMEFGINPEEALNSYEQRFGAALIKLGLPIVGIDTYIQGDEPRTRDETDRLCDRKMADVSMPERRRLAKEFILERLRLANEFILEHKIKNCYIAVITKIFLQYKENVETIPKFFIEYEKNKPSLEGETKGVVDVYRSERRREEEEFIRKNNINPCYIGALEKHYPEYEENKPPSEGGTKGMADVPMPEIRLLANEFILEHKIKNFYIAAITNIFLQCDEGKPLSIGIKIDNLPLVMKLIREAPSANEYEIAERAVEALFEVSQAKSSLKDGNLLGAFGRTLGLVEKMRLFVISEMQLGYLIGETKGDVSALNNEDKIAFAEIWHKEAYELFLAMEKENPAKPKRNWRFLLYSKIADTLRVKYSSKLSELKVSLSDVTVGDSIRTSIKESKKKV